MLSECQKTQRMESCRRIVQRLQLEGVDFLSRTVTADEMWIHLYDRQSIEVLGHPPYSPDLAPCDFFLFPTLKKIL